VLRKAAPPQSGPVVPAPRMPGLVPATAAPVLDVCDIVPLLVADFSGEYQVHVAAAAECLALLRFALSLLATPFVVTAAMIGAKVLLPADVTSWSRIPGYVFALLLAFGTLAILPYLRMIAANIAHVRTARAINNFRLLYARELREHFLASASVSPGPARTWTPNLPVDPHYPDSFAPLSWPGINALVLALLVAAEISTGVIGLSHVRPAPGLVAFGVLAVALILFGIYYIRTNIPSRRKPGNPLGFPDVET
jgi:hypothetical protein